MIELTEDEFWFIHDAMVAIADPLKPLPVVEMARKEFEVVKLLELIAQRVT